MSRSLIHSATQYLDERAKNGLLAAFADRVSTASTAAYYSVPSPTRTGFFPSSFRRPDRPWSPTSATGMDAAMVRGGGVSSGDTE